MAKQNAPKGAAETQSALSKQEDFILKYKNFFIGAVVALIVIVVGLNYWNNHRRRCRPPSWPCSLP